MAWLCGELKEESEVSAAFTIRTERSFDQDPRFGLVVLAEIASRALSLQSMTTAPPLMYSGAL
ncbi:DUF2254 family protein [Vibrio natriegens]|uniref:DUF2254 family protein n=1 Tax=Vibrio natriegens TaxID=691 RepID=UPI001AE08C0C